MSYPASNHYIPSTYYSAPQLSPHAHMHAATPVPHQEPAQRKRPKYTRSKTGCLTCRVKKIKCDEVKPDCTRCTHGQRDCVWPDGVPVRKKSVRKESTERPDTAGSSGASEGSTSPAREATPPKRIAADLGPPPSVSRHQSDPYSQLHHAIPMDSHPGHRQSLHSDRGSTHGYPSMHHPNQHPNMIPMIPDIASYPTHHRYDQGYHSGRPGFDHYQHHLSGGSMRPINHHQSVNQWAPSMMDPIDPYFHNVPERSLVGHSAHNQHPRY